MMVDWNNDIIIYIYIYNSITIIVFGNRTIGSVSGRFSY